MRDVTVRLRRLHPWCRRCQCGATSCVGFLGGHAKAFQAALAAEGAAGCVRTAALNGFDHASDGDGSGVDDLSDFGSDGDEGIAGGIVAVTPPMHPAHPLQFGPPDRAVAGGLPNVRCPAAAAPAAAAAAAAEASVAGPVKDAPVKQRQSIGSARSGKRKRRSASTAAVGPALGPDAISRGHDAAARHHSTCQRQRLGSPAAEEFEVRHNALSRRLSAVQVQATFAANQLS